MGASEYVVLGAVQGIAGSDSARVLVTNHDVVALLRVLVVVRQMIEANANLGR